MLQVSQTYGVRRPAAIRSKIARAAALQLCHERTAQTNAHNAAILADMAQTAPLPIIAAQVETAASEPTEAQRHRNTARLYRERAPLEAPEKCALVLQWADEEDARADALDERELTDADAPAEVEPIQTTTTPAPLEALDYAAMLADLEAMRRADHRAHLDALIIERLTLRRDLVSLENADADGRFDGADFSDEIDAVQSRLEELDELLIMEDDAPFILGFDDLPAAYFEAVLAA